WRLNTPLSCLQPPQQGKTLLYTVVSMTDLINTGSSYRSGAPTQHNDYWKVVSYLQIVFTPSHITKVTNAQPPLDFTLHLLC
ncbi:hypothetical protein, partial [Klebsiella pneumoniae]